MPARSNLNQWRQALRSAQTNHQEIIRQMAPAVAREARDTIRRRLPPGATSSSGMTNPFPGYAATGRLKESIVAGPATKAGNSFRIYVGLARHARKLERMKFAVHEYGMVIKARNKPYLTFKIGDKWISTKRVRIRAKRFFRSGWDEVRRRFPELMGQYVRQRWGQGRR